MQVVACAREAPSSALSRFHTVVNKGEATGMDVKGGSPLVCACHLPGAAAAASPPPFSDCTPLPPDEMPHAWPPLRTSAVAGKGKAPAGASTAGRRALRRGRRAAWQSGPPASTHFDRGAVRVGSPRTGHGPRCTASAPMLPVSGWAWAGLLGMPARCRRVGAAPADSTPQPAPRRLMMELKTNLGQTGSCGAGWIRESGSGPGAEDPPRTCVGHPSRSSYHRHIKQRPLIPLFLEQQPLSQQNAPATPRARPGAAALRTGEDRHKKHAHLV